MVLVISRAKVYCQYTPVSVFWAWEGLIHPSAKILVSWKPQVEYVRAKCQRAAQLHINPREISFFIVLGVRTNKKKNLKVIWRELRQQFIMGTKNN